MGLASLDGGEFDAGKFENAALATLNFLVNGLTLGFADLTEDGQEVTKEDFGQTLAAYDVPEGSYVMVPVLGPRTTRSLTGTAVDFVMNPLSVFGTGGTVETINAAQAPVGASASGRRISKPSMM